MRPVAVALLVIAAAGAASADVVPVRSGEHAGFSRLVLEFDERPRWTVRRADGRTEIAFDPAPDDFALDRVFDRIPRTRIRAVTATGDGLRLDLGCACDVRVFSARDAAVAIDVTDEPALVVSDVQPTAADVLDAPAPEVLGTDPWPPLALPDSWTDPPRPEDADRAPVAGPPPVAALPATADPAPRVGPGTDDVLSLLAEGMARASTQGLLRPATPDGQPGEGIPTTGEVPANLRLRLPGEMAPGEDAAAEGEACPAEDAFDTAAWMPPDLTPAEAIASARSALAPDIDALSEEAALALARLYLALGFGAEARAVIEATLPAPQRTGLLLDMAAIVDGNPPPGGSLAIPPGCGGRAQLWAALATGEPTTPEDVIVAVSELPLPLRRTLGPRLIRIYADAGDTATAGTLRAAVERAPGPHGDAFEAAAARLGAATGEPRALEALRVVAESAAPSSDEALADYLTLGPADASTVGEMIARATSRADELRGTDEGVRLEAAAIRAAIVSGDLDTATARLTRAISEEGLPAEWADRLAAELLQAAAAGQDDAALLVAATGLRNRAPAVRAEAAGPAVAARLLALGLPDLARDYLPDKPSDPATIALVARRHLASGDPSAALATLGTGSDPELLRLRAEALDSLGRAGEAVEVYRTLGDVAAADRAAWRSGERAAPSDIAGGEAAELLSAPAAPDAAARDLLATSAQTRDLVEDLLDTFPAP